MSQTEVIVTGINARLAVGTAYRRARRCRLHGELRRCLAKNELYRRNDEDSNEWPG